MLKHCRMLVFIALLVGMASGAAFAGTTLVNYGGNGARNASVALEAVGADRTVVFYGAGNVGKVNGAANNPIGFTTGQALATGNLLVATLTGAKFPGDAINVCGLTAGGASPGANSVSVGNATPAANSTTATFQLGAAAANVLTNEGLYLTNQNCAAAAGNIAIAIAQTAAAGTATIALKVQTSGGVDLDTSTAVPLATIARQLSDGHTASTHTIDYLGTPFNGTRLISVGTTAPGITADGAANGGSNNVVFTVAAANFGVAAGTNGSGAANNAGLTVSAVVSVQDTASWQGISRVYLVPQVAGTVCNNANAVSNTAVAPLSGTIALNVTAVGFAGNVVGDKPLALCLQANGTSSLQTRTISVAEDINVSTGGNDPTPDAFDTAMTWTVNAYQALVPWVINSTVAPTFCLVNNNDATTTGTVVLDVTSSENTTLITNATLGTVAPSTSKLLTFTGNSASLTGGTAVDLTNLGANGRYSARVSVTSNPTNVTLSCQQTDPITGSKRPVPVLTDGASTRYYKN
jgi:hypothetical protein